VLNAAEFGNQPVDEGSEDGLGQRARELIEQVTDLAGHDERHDRGDRGEH
jgi:hypothetical protein